MPFPAFYAKLTLSCHTGHTPRTLNIFLQDIPCTWNTSSHPPSTPQISTTHNKLDSHIIFQIFSSMPSFIFFLFGITVRYLSMAPRVWFAIALILTLCFLHHPVISSFTPKYITSFTYSLAPWLHSPLTALATLITGTHSSLSTAFCHHLLTFISHRSFSIPSHHLSLCVPLLLFPSSWLSNTFLTVLPSSILTTCPIHSNHFFLITANFIYYFQLLHLHVQLFILFKLSSILENHHFCFLEIKFTVLAKFFYFIFPLCKPFIAKKPTATSSANKKI